MKFRCLSFMPLFILTKPVSVSSPVVPDRNLSTRLGSMLTTPSSQVICIPTSLLSFISNEGVFGLNDTVDIVINKFGRSHTVIPKMAQRRVDGQLLSSTIPSRPDAISTAPKGDERSPCRHVTADTTWGPNKEHPRP